MPSGEGDGSGIGAIDSWEELAETLLADITRQMAGDAQNGSDETAADAGAASALPGRVVGTGAVGVESRGNSSSRRSVSHDHAYQQVVADQKNNSNSDRSSHGEVVMSNSSSGQQQVEGKTGEEASSAAIDENDNDNEVVFGTYDERTNCITLYVPEEQQQQKEDVVEVCVAEEIKSMAEPLEPCLSPVSSLAMESGYQSLGSPAAAFCDDDDDLWSTSEKGGDGLDELWNDSFSELFPSLV